MENSKFIGDLEMYITYKEKIPFDFYHYWNLGHNININRKQRERENKLNNDYGILVQ
jgi:hypothetical protein